MADFILYARDCAKRAAAVETNGKASRQISPNTRTPHTDNIATKLQRSHYALLLVCSFIDHNRSGLVVSRHWLDIVSWLQKAEGSKCADLTSAGPALTGRS